ncbi:MAG: hypothetical protein Q9163_006097, partial [Psora crenata]
MADRGMTPFYEGIEQYKHQFFQWHYIEGTKLKDVAKRFDQLFEEMYDQWQTRKRRWDKEWRIAQGGPTPEILEDLDNLPLWYEGTRKVRELIPSRVVSEP